MFPRYIHILYKMLLHSVRIYADEMPKIYLRSIYLMRLNQTTKQAYFTHKIHNIRKSEITKRRRSFLSIYNISIHDDRRQLQRRPHGTASTFSRLMSARKSARLFARQKVWFILKFLLQSRQVCCLWTYCVMVRREGDCFIEIVVCFYIVSYILEHL